MVETLTKEIFELYCEPKSKSNMWNRPRLEVKQKLLSFASSLPISLLKNDKGMEFSASDHYPSVWNSRCVDRQWIFFSRDSRARKVVEEVIDVNKTLASTLADPTPYFKHLFIGIDLNATAIGTAVYLHWNAWVDRENFINKITLEDEAKKWVEMINGLPEEYVVRIDGMKTIPATAYNPDDNSKIIESYSEAKGFLSIGIFIPRQQIFKLGKDLWDVLKVAFMLLLPVYEFILWTPNNDLISMKDKRRQVEEKRLEVAMLHEMELETFKSLKEKEKRRQKERLEELKKQIAEFHEYEKSREIKARGPTFVEKKEHSPKTASEQPSTTKKQSKTKKVQPAIQTTEAIQQRELKFGDRVRILTGIFKGKWGIIQEVSNKGRVKVIVGSLITRLNSNEVEIIKRKRNLSSRTNPPHTGGK